METLILTSTTDLALRIAHQTLKKYIAMGMIDTTSTGHITEQMFRKFIAKYTTIKMNEKEN